MNFSDCAGGKTSVTGAVEGTLYKEGREPKAALFSFSLSRSPSPLRPRRLRSSQEDHHRHRHRYDNYPPCKNSASNQGPTR